MSDPRILGVVISHPHDGNPLRPSPSSCRARTRRAEGIRNLDGNTNDHI